MKLFKRDYNLKTHSERVLGYTWCRCYTCTNYVYKVKKIGEVKVDFIHNEDICEICYMD
jgi:hypothetical protein